MVKTILVFKAQNIYRPGSRTGRVQKAIATANLLFRFSKPDCVVQPANPAQVQAIIKKAKSRKVKLDMQSMTVTMDAGCQWGDVYETLIIGGHDGYIINGGRCPTVGVSGFILGGGLGPFTRSFGMGSDTLVEAVVVSAKGELVTVRETDNKRSDNGRLFWALRGAGGGNFGVLVQLKMRVQKLSNREGMVVAGRYQWFPKSGFTREVIDTMNDFYTTRWPNKLTIDTTWICDLRPNSPPSGVWFNISFDGSKGEFDRLIDRNIANLELKTQLKRRVLSEKSTRYLYETLVAQWLEETERAYPTNKTYELYSSFIFKNDDRAVIAKSTTISRDLTTTFRKRFTGEQVNFLITWIHSGGKATETDPTATAFFWREAVFHVYVTVEWVDKWIQRDMRLFLAEAKRALRPLSLNGEAAFINFPDRDFPTKAHESAYFGGNRDELRRVKQIWDRDNFFKWAQGVRRPGDPEEDAGDVEDEDKTDKLASEQWAHQWTCYKTKDLQADFDELADMGYGEED